MIKKALLTLLFISFCIFANAQGKDILILETEDFSFKGQWDVGNLDRQAFLSTEKDDSTPSTLVNMPQEGAYNIWVNSYDYEKNYPKSRKFKVLVNGVETEIFGGTHGKDGWQWQNLGKLNFKKGANLITLKRGGMYPRCDVIIFTANDAWRPNDDYLRSRYNRLRHQIESSGTTSHSVYHTEFLKLKGSAAIPNAKSASIENNNAKIIFTEKLDKNGLKYYERSAQVNVQGKWITLPAFTDEAYFVGYSETDPIYSDNSYFSNWKKGTHGTITVNFDGTNLELKTDAIYPYAPEQMLAMLPRKIELASKNAFKISFDKPDVYALMTLLETGAVKLDFVYNVKKDGYYTAGMLAFKAVEKAKVSAVQMPPLFQLRMLMEEPKMLGNRYTSQPIALMQINADNNTPVYYALAANPDNLPKEEWSYKKSSIYGFSLSSPDNFAQPAIFQPILGGRNSYKKAGEKIESSWYILNLSGKWYDGLEFANNNIFPAGKIFREPFETSLSDAIANIASYLKNPEASGWSKELKARWNIEDKDLVTTSSPLAELEVALLTDDEQYYKDIALPTIEYTLTRESAHFSPRKEASPYSKTPYAMKVPSKMWKADYYAGMGKLLGNSNIWVEEFWKNASKENLYSSMPEWTSVLGLYLANPSEELLLKAKSLCDAWLEKAFITTTIQETDYSHFANVSFYPYWWYLPDMYAITKDKKYLNFAERGAFHSLAALWAYPAPTDGEITINKGNSIRGIGHTWWRGPERFRLGFDFQLASKTFIENWQKVLPKGPHDAAYIMPEKKVPALKVSRIGLGIEQPSTFKAGSDGHDFNILMPSWSAEMLKVYQYTNKDILKKYSRHAIIGRFANFLGYYICDYTDVQHDEMYPYKGPDITSFYYHHAPCHFAQSYDYLMAQFEVATDGKIAFPYVRQQGYVWFTDRIFGTEGKIFDEQGCRPIIDKSAVRPDTPKVSVLTARSKDGIWALLLNDTNAEITTNVVFDSTSKLMQGALVNNPIKVFNSAGNSMSTLEFYGDKSIKIPAQNVIALRIDAEAKEVFKPLPKMSNGGHITKAKASETFGDLHAFRIRSPFGKDSLYVMTTLGVETKAKLTLQITAPYNQTLSCKQFPYEVSVYPLPMDSVISFKVSIQEEGKPIENLGEYTINP